MAKTRITRKMLMSQYEKINETDAEIVEMGKRLSAAGLISRRRWPAYVEGNPWTLREAYDDAAAKLAHLTKEHEHLSRLCRLCLKADAAASNV